MLDSFSLHRTMHFVSFADIDDVYRAVDDEDDGERADFEDAGDDDPAA